MRALLLALLACLLGSVVAPVWAVATLADKRVLVLAPYGYGRPGLDNFVRTYVENLAAAGVGRENIVVEYLHLNRSGDPEQRRRRSELLLMQHGASRFDLLVALQQPSQDYLFNELAQLSPEAPVLAVNTTSQPQSNAGNRRVLRVDPDPEVARTLEQAMRLFPDTRRLIVALGAGTADQLEKTLIERAIAKLARPLQVEYTDHLPVAAMRSRLATAPPNSIVLMGLVNSDVTGATFAPVDVSTLLAAASTAPSFVHYSTMVGRGAVGGVVLHIERRAEQLAKTSLAIISGDMKLSSGTSGLSVVATSMYDWSELKRWGANPAVLPADTLFINRPPSLWEQHRTTVVASAVVFFILLLLLSGLLVQRRRLRQAQLRSRESEARFRVLVEHAPEAIVVYDAAAGRLVDANSKAEQLFGCSRAELLSGGLERFYAPLQPDGLPAAESVTMHAQRAMAGEAIMFERAICSRDGRTFPCEVNVVALPSSSGTLLRGGYVDISERKRAEQELVRHRDHLEEQVAERTEALSVAVRDAQAANRAKSVFLANMSHELRTPLNSIIGFSQIMAESTSMFDEEKRNLGIIHRSGQHLLALINDILELSKIEAGQARLVRESVDMGLLLREIIDMLRLGAERKGVALLVDCPELPPPLLLDGGKLRQVLINLLSNAVKFTERGSVTLSLACTPVGAAVALRFSVRDTGIGIPADELERIFEPFMQVATTGSQTGTGLGLTISREFVKLLGGSMELRSQPSVGSEFCFSIEAARDADAALTSDAALPFTPQAAPVTAPVALPARVDAAALRVLVGESRAHLRSALQQLDMAGVGLQLDAIRPAHPALAAALDAMLANHQYRQLHEMLEQAGQGEAR